MWIYANWQWFWVKPQSPQDAQQGLRQGRCQFSLHRILYSSTRLLPGYNFRITSLEGATDIIPEHYTLTYSLDNDKSS